jgi:hypothetical protein
MVNPYDEAPASVPDPTQKGIQVHYSTDDSHPPVMCICPIGITHTDDEYYEHPLNRTGEHD